ncbi:hypothetical protein K440DRAFT_188124 [Wilcoxina mikolae CBS 423.85]|nr:hypothetical protein K440DRAFT_188124 [Wilcoxina mikolae CBS 423.85]
MGSCPCDPKAGKGRRTLSLLRFFSSFSLWGRCRRCLRCFSSPGSTVLPYIFLVPQPWTLRAAALSRLRSSTRLLLVSSLPAHSSSSSTSTSKKSSSSPGRTFNSVVAHGAVLSAKHQLRPHRAGILIFSNTISEPLALLSRYRVDK